MSKKVPHRKQRTRTIQILLAVAATALLALSLYPLTRAASFASASEAENGAVGGNATKSPVPGSSGAQAVLFTATPSSGSCTAPSNNKLLDQDMSDTQHPWQRKGAAEVIIYFETKNVAAEYIPYMEYGAAAWSKSECLDVRLASSCPSGANCVPSATPKTCDDSDGNYDEVVKSGYQVNGGNLMEMCTDPLNKLGSGAKKNVTVHEMGHAVGLRHRATKRVLMESPTYKDIFDPDETDYHNLRVSYGNQN